MSVTLTESIDDKPMTAAAGGTAPRPFGWAWVWRSLRLRKWQALAVLVLTVVVHAAGLALPLCTQQAVDLIAAGTVDLQLAWLGAAAVIAIAIEAALTSLRQKLVLGLMDFLRRRISSRAFLHLMRRRIDLGAANAGEMINRFQEADKIPGFVLRMLPQVAFDAGNGVVSLLLMLYYDAVIGLATLVVTIVSVVLLGRQLRAWDEDVERMFKTQGKRQGVLSECVNGIITIKALALETQRFGRWKDVTETAIAASYRLFDRVRRFHVTSGTLCARSA